MVDGKKKGPLETDLDDANLNQLQEKQKWKGRNSLFVECFPACKEV